MKRHLFVFNVVGLSPRHLKEADRYPALSSLIKNGRFAEMTPVFPGLTLPAQASITTGEPPSKHGIVANGFYYRDRYAVSFWDQYRSLVQAPPFWEQIVENRDMTTALLFWQNTLFGHADFIVTPKPLHFEDGLIQWCYSKPVGLYEDLSREIGPFDLFHYWGPFASEKSAKWIAASAELLLARHQPDLMLIYLPLLDYSSQRLGPDDPRVFAELEVIDGLIGSFMDRVRRMGLAATYAVISEYSMTRVSGAVPLNRILRKAGLLNVREIAGKEYLDFEMSRAFAMVDHQIAHVYVQGGVEQEVFGILSGTDGVAMVLDGPEKAAHGIDHPRSGECIAVSAPDRWFSYPWWEDPEKAPSFARTVDIHNKPGYDPLELFLEPGTRSIATNPLLIKGSHGAPPSGGEGMAVCILGGEGVQRAAMPEKVHMLDLAGMFKKILAG